MSASRRVTAAWLIPGVSWRTVVNGGSVKAMSGESSYPTTDRSAGTASPRRRASAMTPSAMMSLPQVMAVQPAARSCRAA